MVQLPKPYLIAYITHTEDNRTTRIVEACVITICRYIGDDDCPSHLVINIRIFFLIWTCVGTQRGIIIQDTSLIGLVVPGWRFFVHFTQVNQIFLFFFYFFIINWKTNVTGRHGSQITPLTQKRRPDRL